MIKDEFCFVCVPFINERSRRCKEPDCDVNYSLVNITACDGVERAGFVPVSPVHLWDICFKYNYNKERIIQAGLRLIELCECFYFCDCEYDENTHKEMKLWHDRAKALKKEFITINERFLK